MKIGFIGLGKLGFPCALAMAAKGHDVLGYDINSANMSLEPRAYNEACDDGVTPMNTILQSSTLRFGSLQAVVAHGDILFVAVQTPHDARFEGITRLPDERVDFDYTYLVDAIKSISAAARTLKNVIIISTVLPGTIRNCVLPHVSDLLRLCYNPFFIAMGTTMRDFLHPEFVLGRRDHPICANHSKLLCDDHRCADLPYVDRKCRADQKVAYNTYIGMKIVFANTLMEICHKTPGANVDDVTGALKAAHHRLISRRYLGWRDGRRRGLSSSR